MADDVAPFDEKVEALVREEFGDEATPEFINMLRLGKAAYEHGYNGFISREKVEEWARRMYEAGQQQKRIRSMEEEGMVLINSGDVVNAGAYLSTFGKREGYLTRKADCADM